MMSLFERMDTIRPRTRVYNARCAHTPQRVDMMLWVMKSGTYWFVISILLHKIEFYVRFVLFLAVLFVGFSESWRLGSHNSRYDGVR